jgi:hypothetical protein
MLIASEDVDLTEGLQEIAKARGVRCLVKLLRELCPDGG